jgi:hypothetical protein
MTTVPTHFEDKHRMAMLEKYSVCSTETVGILCIIEKLAGSHLSEAYLKTDKFEIRIKRQEK